MLTRRSPRLGVPLGGCACGLVAVPCAACLGRESVSCGTSRIRGSNWPCRVASGPGVRGAQETSGAMALGAVVARTDRRCHAWSGHATRLLRDDETRAKKRAVVSCIGAADRRWHDAERKRKRLVLITRFPWPDRQQVGGPREDMRLCSSTSACVAL